MWTCVKKKNKLVQSDVQFVRCLLKGDLTSSFTVILLNSVSMIHSLKKSLSYVGPPLLQACCPFEPTSDWLSLTNRRSKQQVAVASVFTARDVYLRWPYPGPPLSQTSFKQKKQKTKKGIIGMFRVVCSPTFWLTGIIWTYADLMIWNRHFPHKCVSRV